MKWGIKLIKIKERLKIRINKENINLSLFLSGKAISLFGSSIYTFVVGLYILRLTGSGLSFATNIVLYTIPMIFINPFAGVFVDKLDKKIIVVGADLVNGIFLFSVYLLAAKIGLSPYLIYISTFIMTVFSNIFNIGIESSKPNLVNKENLVKINSLARIIESFSYLIGPVLGGLIYSLINTHFFILLNAISFLFAALLEFFINYHYNDNIKSNSKTKIDNKKNIWFNLKEGYNYIFSRPYLKSLIYIFISLNFFFNFTIIVPLPYILNNIWEVNSVIYGIVQGGLPVGMITGAFLVDRILKIIDYDVLLSKICFYTGIGVLVFILPLQIYSKPPNELFILFYYTLLMFLGGIIVSWVDIPASVLIQRMVPGEILGRVISVKLSIIKIIVPIALIVSGYFLEIISPIYVIIIGSGIFLSFSIWFFIWNEKKLIESIRGLNFKENK